MTSPFTAKLTPGRIGFHTNGHQAIRKSWVLADALPSATYTQSYRMDWRVVFYDKRLLTVFDQ